MIVNGHYRGMEAILEGIDEKNFSAQLAIDSVMYKLTGCVNAVLVLQNFSTFTHLP